MIAPLPLFPELAETLSPLAAWLQLYGLETAHSPEVPPGVTDPETGREVKPWVCVPRFLIAGGESPSFRHCGLGDTREEACADFAAKFNLKHWSLS